MSSERIPKVSQSDDAAAVRALYEQLMSAWNQGSGEASFEMSKDVRCRYHFGGSDTCALPLRALAVAQREPGFTRFGCNASIFS
jgi:hypothetical protein